MHGRIKDETASAYESLSDYRCTPQKSPVLGQEIGAACALHFHSTSTPLVIKLVNVLPLQRATKVEAEPAFVAA